LHDLGEAPVEMKVTLSYFIEPNPSARGTRSKFHYPSHRLRFDVQRPLDASTTDFLARLERCGRPRRRSGDPIDPGTQIGCSAIGLRHRGSLHQDVWRGTAAESQVGASLLYILLAVGGAADLRNSASIYRPGTA
jgi:hypothetical protein